MASAPLGDDVYGEDPTVNALQKRLAKMFGKAKSTFFSNRNNGQSSSYKTAYTTWVNK